jgi:hypothetical protein
MTVLLLVLEQEKSLDRPPRSLTESHYESTSFRAGGRRHCQYLTTTFVGGVPIAAQDPSMFESGPHSQYGAILREKCWGEASCDALGHSNA